MKVVMSEMEAFDHAEYFGRGVHRFDGRRCGLCGWPEGKVAGALPESGFGVDVGEERAGDTGEECVEVVVG